MFRILFWFLFVFPVASFFHQGIQVGWRRSRDCWLQESSRDDDLEEFPRYCPIHVIASTDEIILPGEEKTLTLTDDEAIPLIQNLCEQKLDCVAMAVQLQDTTLHFEEDWTMAQVASNCKILGLTAAKEDQVKVTIRCIGRVRLGRMLESYTSSHFRFSGEEIVESLNTEEDFKKACLVEENIDMLMKQWPAKEGNLGNERKEPITSPVNTQSWHNNYIQTKETVLQAIMDDPANRKSFSTCTTSSQELQLKATSWAVFQCLNNPKLDARYRLRALDWDNLLERLKLAQYALRERNLLVQGEALVREGGPKDYASEFDGDTFQ